MSSTSKLVAAAAVLVLIAILIWAFAFRSDRLDPWAESTVPYDPECTSECEVLGELADTAHGAPAVTVSVNPNVDDPIAQWSDCLSDVMTCVQDKTDPFQPLEVKAPVFNTCVIESQCPDPCIERYQRLAQNDSTRMEQAFNRVFADKDAICAPRVS